MIDYNGRKWSQLGRHVLSGEVANVLAKYQRDEDPTLGIQAALNYVERELRRDYPHAADRVLGDVKEIAMKTDVVTQEKWRIDGDRIREVVKKNGVSERYHALLPDYAALFAIDNAGELVERKIQNTSEKENPISESI
ncbi:MAG: hypothetical protein V1944_02765 [Candidatus Aenigmatarchaeota archaeon]